MSNVDTETLQHVSNEPWSNFTSADYSVEQWHAACLIHLHDGAPTSKSECKLPVKTPSGEVNRNGVHAAAAALNGARGGVNASSDQKQSARRALIRLYSQLDEDAPDSIKQSMDTGKDFIEHYGVKGQRWGVRRSRSALARASGRKPAKDMSDDELRTVINRMNMEKQYNSLTSNSSVSSAGAKFVKDMALGIAREQLRNTVSAQVGKALKKKLG